MPLTVDDALALADKRIRDLEAKLTAARAGREFLLSLAESRPSPEKAVATPRAETTNRTLPEIAREILREAGRPLHVRDITAEAEERGAKGTSKTSLRVMMTGALHRSRLFRKTRPGTFTLVEQDETGKQEHQNEEKPPASTDGP